jgi:hypothetical protein
MRYVVDDFEAGPSGHGLDANPAKRESAGGFTLATASSTPITRSPSNMEVAPERSSSTPMLLPLPLPGEGELPCRGPGKPRTPRIVDGDLTVPSAEAPGVLETGSERIPPLLSSRLSFPACYHILICAK